jgi:MFS family permease
MAILLSYYYLHSEQLKHVPALDSLGFILFGASLAGVTFSLSELSKTTINYYIALSILCCSLLLLRAYSKHSKQQKYPIIKTTLLKLRTFRVSILGNLFSRLGFGGLPFLIPLFLQLILGYSAQLSGFLFMPIALGVVFAKPCTLFILRTFGYKRFLIVNTLFASCITGMFSCINSHTPLYIIGLLTFVYGFIVTLHYSALNSLAYSNISAKQLSSATSIMGTLQQLAQSFGIAVSAILIHVFSFIYSTELTAGIFQYTFFSMGFLTLISTVIFTQLKKEDGKQMLGDKS